MVKKNQEIQTKNLERRVFAVEDVELRVSDGDGPQITGYAAKFGKKSVNLGGFTEHIQKGAFDEALKNSDVCALKNHDSNLLLGRSTSGTLRLKTNSVGLYFEIDPPNTTTGRDTIEEIRRKDLNGCSFAFIIAEDAWKNNEDGTVERTIIKVEQLFDVGPVTKPAYLDTTVSIRSQNSFEEYRAAVERRKKQPENKEKEIERNRQFEKKYRKAGRIINRNKSTDV
ncbi:HK97 family phage prohead protease [Candidatus Pacearchaeota archaeon]|nr:HK97 family phage prohead protease [Candidatus Pacearchaeota archaeon]